MIVPRPAASPPLLLRSRHAGLLSLEADPVGNRRQIRGGLSPCRIRREVVGVCPSGYYREDGQTDSASDKEGEFARRV